MRFLHSIAVPERAVAADAVESFDLPVNPLSALLIGIKPLNDTGTLANLIGYREAVQAFNRITVSYRGASVLSMRGEDLAALNWFRHGIAGSIANGDNVNDERQCFVLPLLFGRFPYDPSSCFPSSRRGELVIEFDIDVADTGYNDFRYLVESIELLGANPREYERKTTIARTFAATGDNDIELPLGNTVRGLLLRGTTGFAGASPAPSLGRMSLMLDNQEVGFADTDFEIAQSLAGLFGRAYHPWQDHTHIITTDGNAQTELETLAGPIHETLAANSWGDFVYLDLDPTRDDTFALDTKSAATLLLRVNAETADAVRVIPVERVSA